MFKVTLRYTLVACEDIHLSESKSQVRTSVQELHSLTKPSCVVLTCEIPLKSHKNVDHSQKDSSGFMVMLAQI